MARRVSTASIFFWPAMVALVSAAGLAFALIGDGVWDTLSWLALAEPVALSLWFWCASSTRV
jgi:hypothetical protein